ncbi:hypothetical protein [Blastococcus sp. Marseille-P5729]|uniref:hypothetical protein n=1 Tax=Blastococcus sp. Marseille-P5729 TaxID=2086582 RepID=UPI00131AD67C|nr:hypothetical protein [Blastococcus sp. Marseille-P5729]
MSTPTQPPAPHAPAPWPHPPVPGPPHSAGSGVTYTVIAPGPAYPMGPQAAGTGMAPRPVPASFPAPRPRVDQQVVRVLYAGLGLIGVGLGVSLPGPVGIGWGAFTAWAIFGVVCALVVLGATAVESAPASWPLAQVAAGGLLLFWLIALRPIAISDVGFLGTVGVVAAIGALLLSPNRTWSLPGEASRRSPSRPPVI